MAYRVHPKDSPLVADAAGRAEELHWLPPVELWSFSISKPSGIRSICASLVFPSVP